MKTEPAWEAHGAEATSVSYSQGFDNLDNDRKRAHQAKGGPCKRGRLMLEVGEIAVVGLMTRGVSREELGCAALVA